MRSNQEDGNIAISKGDKLEVWKGRILLIKDTIVRTAPPQNSLGSLVEQIVPTMWLYFRLATSFCCEVLVHEIR